MVGLGPVVASRGTQLTDIIRVHRHLFAFGAVPEKTDAFDSRVLALLFTFSFGTLQLLQRFVSIKVAVSSLRSFPNTGALRVQTMIKGSPIFIHPR